MPFAIFLFCCFCIFSSLGNFLSSISGLNKWVEIGNSGMFRPEMLLPMGLPENVNVIAWGLSLERYGIISSSSNGVGSFVGVWLYWKFFI